MTENKIHKYQAHPWHGIPVRAGSSEAVNAFIEMTPFDSVKYEVDKATGFIKVDRPQKFSNIVPALYGFIPQTYCGEQVAEYCMTATERSGIIGDKDPLDICVLTERNINHGNIIVPALPIGGLRMIDGGEADDKIIAILKGDEVFGDWTSIEDCPDSLINRLMHYFLTYKQMPDDGRKKKIEITDVYSSDVAHQIIEKSIEDYNVHFKITQ